MGNQERCLVSSFLVSLGAYLNGPPHTFHNEQDALAKAAHYFGGMQILNQITNITGLMGRSAVMPGEYHSPGPWTNSTNPAYAVSV